MDDITKLILAKYQVENIIELTKDNEYKQFIFMHLNPVRTGYVMDDITKLILASIKLKTSLIDKREYKQFIFMS